MAEATQDEIAALKGAIMALEVAFVGLASHMLLAADEDERHAILRTISGPTVIQRTAGPRPAEAERPRALAMRAFEARLAQISDALAAVVGNADPR